MCAFVSSGYRGMASRTVLAGLWLLGYFHFACARSALYNTTNSRAHGKLNVHIVSHTHNDPGWLFDYVQYHRPFVLDGHRFVCPGDLLPYAVRG